MHNVENVINTETVNNYHGDGDLPGMAEMADTGDSGLFGGDMGGDWDIGDFGDF